MKKNTALVPFIQLWADYQILFFIIGWLSISFATLTPLEQLPIQVPGSDKLHHIIGFAGWTLMIAAGKQKVMRNLCVIIFLWGGAIELIQPYVNRHGEWEDFAANTIGILGAYIFILLIKKTFSQAK